MPLVTLLEELDALAVLAAVLAVEVDRERARLEEAESDEEAGPGGPASSFPCACGWEWASPTARGLRPGLWLR